MRKSGIEVVTDVRNLLNVPAVTTALAGGKVYQHLRMPDSDKSDIVVALLGNSNDLFQEATLNVFVHAQTLKPPVVAYPQPDLAKMKLIVDLITPLLDGVWKGSFNTEIANDYARQDEDGSWFHRIILDYRSYNKNYKNI